MTPRARCPRASSSTNIRLLLFVTLFPLSSRCLSHQLFSRDASCASGTTHCDGFPSDFCCPASTSCTSINSGKSLLCCPDGINCSAFRPISCDLSLQNATSQPLNPIKSTDLTTPLPKCGSMCCPAGYTCQDDNACIQNTSTSPSSTSRASSSPTTNPSSQATSISTLPASSTTSSTPEQQQNPAYPARAIFAGFFPGLVAGVLLTLIGVICLGRKRKRSQQISSPILQSSNSGTRTDFLLRSSPPNEVIGTPPTAAGGPPSRRVSRVRSLFRRDTSKSAVTHKSNSSGEEISVFASNLGGHNGGGSGGYGPDRRSAMTQKTTFTDLMGDAGFSKGAPFLSPAGHTPPVPGMGRGLGGSMASVQR